MEKEEEGEKQNQVGKEPNVVAPIKGERQVAMKKSRRARGRVLEKFEELIKLENIHEMKELEMCYAHLTKDELIEKGILLNDLTIKTATKYSDNQNAYIVKLVKRKKKTKTNDLSDEENIENFNNNMFGKGSIVHFSRKRKGYCLDKEHTVVNKNSVIKDIVNIYVCTVHKVKKNQVNLIVRHVDELCKELNISNTYLLVDKSYFDVCLVNSEISMQRQLQAINLMKGTLENPSDVVKILFFRKAPSQDLFLRQVLGIFRRKEQGEKNLKNEPLSLSEESPKVEEASDLSDHANGDPPISYPTGYPTSYPTGYPTGYPSSYPIGYPSAEDLANESNYIHQCDKTEWGNKNLNDSQKKAVYFCLYSKDIFCVHGPPGTGKTTVLCEVIYQLVKRNKKILVTGPSNVSVDNILRKCINMNVKNVVRIGIKSKISKDLWSYSYDEKIKSCDSYKLCEDIDKDIEKMKTEINKLKSKKKNEKTPFDRKGIANLKYEIRMLNKSRKKKKNIFFTEIMNRNNVVFSTCSSSSNYELNKYVKNTNFLFDVVCIDECCQCTEPLCYMPLLLSKKNVFLFGDHKQLAPLVKHNSKNNKLNVTLFERLIKKYKRKISYFLKIQYRMNDLILKWSNKVFYQDRLVSHDSCKAITVEELLFLTPVEKHTGQGAKQMSERKKDTKDKQKKMEKKKKKGKEKEKESGEEEEEGDENPQVNTKLKDMIQSYTYCPITWVETDGFDEFLDDTKELDMIQLEMKEKKDDKVGVKMLSKAPGGVELAVPPLASVVSVAPSSRGAHGDRKENEQKRPDNEDPLEEGLDDLGVYEDDLEEANQSENNITGDEGVFLKNESCSERSSHGEEEEVAVDAEQKEKALEEAVQIDIDDIVNLNNKSRSNRGEAYVVYKLIERMLHVDKISAKHICVITPYSKQMHLLKNILYDNLYGEKNFTSNYKDIEIATVDSFQGREKEIVILSLVCSNYFKNIGFLKDYRRLNVAITRAKRHVVIVGNSSTISNDKLLNELYETVLNHGKVYMVNELVDVEQIPVGA
ncbi:dna2/nam7 helicase family member, putative [Plasmodium knowlesi strain H]|uniref:Dna2/nam7 helicase family member, putative n=3 Tax=Plasmodium knowlesi TaxID=5850 RepID=A0A5K1VN53_PLAKH|nr:DNA replication ATP-dependent helicase/nuclease DNA2, putative [Plasmodium knowlesi strain H]OTN64835.1 putative Dna2/nam7 helicase family member [Plasmodium knowlesi]CAA9988093.1 DNA replication ATP-dependent helicase/nuclease DNA2, putative [Plasmodium knowlesi strain H]SBO19958.1 dna2/nam7 helicase family member, putative [Plasmodium knowlesi strain H]SBO29097.1 dna2/nam7 helicase family member, putative [Plasmodium knowlesi strain H]VVS77567.1 DNA replication ATP-dependent helicase/nucl|eukprot:XP_002259067.1 hypothetical protein, conserved in Plasmodium species [Plasmodium knowlesi strain H]